MNYEECKMFIKKPAESPSFQDNVESSLERIADSMEGIHNLLDIILREEDGEDR